MPCFIAPASVCINDVKVNQNEHGQLTYQLADEEEDVPILDFGSMKKNEFVLLHIGTLIRFADVMNVEYIQMLLREYYIDI